MPGLIARETLMLTVMQTIVLAVCAAAWLHSAPFWRTAGVTLAAMLLAWIGQSVTFDVLLTWNQIAPYHGRIVPLSEMAFLNHLKFQPPVWTWYVSAFPSFIGQQVTAAGVSLLALGLMRALYGERVTRLIAATPLFLLCSCQPMTGLYALAAILTARRLWQMRRPCLAVLSAFLASQFTYTAYAVYPVVCYEFGAYSLALLALTAGYWWAFAQTNTMTYATQAAFVRKMFSLSFDRVATGGSAAAAVRRNTRRMPRNLRAALAAAWYLISVWPMVWRNVVVMSLAAAILLGGGNVKYLLLLFGVLPCQIVDSRPS